MMHTSCNDIYLSHQFGFEYVYNINLSIQPRSNILETNTTSGNRRDIDLTIDAITKKRFDGEKVAVASGKSMIIITGELIYQLMDWHVRNIKLIDDYVSLVIYTNNITINGKLSVTFTDGEYEVNSSDYLDVYHMYGSPEQFTYDEFFVRAVTTGL